MARMTCRASPRFMNLHHPADPVGWGGWRTLNRGRNSAGYNAVPCGRLSRSALSTTRSHGSNVYRRKFATKGNNESCACVFCGLSADGFCSGCADQYCSARHRLSALPQSQPACLTDSTTRLLDCGNWAISASWAVPSTAVSGIYFALLTRSDTGGKSQIFFVVRNDGSHSDLLFQTSDESWQAYNPYGGHSLY